MPKRQVTLLAQNAPTDISVIIVNYGSADLALEAATSVLARPAGERAIDVHPVDNTSPDDDVAGIATRRRQSVMPPHFLKDFWAFAGRPF